MSTDLKSESIFIDVTPGKSTSSDKEILHLKRFYTNSKGAPVFMAHGMIENGKIFYSDSGKGLAPYLAEQGYDVFVADYRGKGESTPAISRRSKYGLKEILDVDMDAYIGEIKKLKGDAQQFWVAHSWGGVVLMAYLARKHANVNIAAMVMFASKRRVSITTLKKMWRIGILWNRVLKLGVHYKGYFDAKRLKVGADNESRKGYLETAIWVKNKKWEDWYDKFDYAKALKQLSLAPTLHLVGIKDDVLGHPEDVNALIEESGHRLAERQILSKRNGNMHDYGHIDILTHQDCPEDVFPIVLAYIKKFQK